MMSSGVRWTSMLLVLGVLMLHSVLSHQEINYEEKCKNESTKDTAQYSLLQAVKNDQPTNVLSLIKEANISMITDQGETLLHVAVVCQSFNALKVLLKSGLDPNTLNNRNFSAVWYATDLGNIGLIKDFKEKGADLHLRACRFSYRWCNDTLLHIAAMKGNEEVIKFLVKLGLEVDARNRFKETPLHVAIQKKQSNAARRLIELGSFINAKDDGGATPLLEACRKGELNLFRFILANGGNINDRDMSGDGVWEYASKAGTDMINELIKMRFPYAATKAIKPTPLHIAGRHGPAETVVALINHGFNVNAVALYGMTPLHFATWYSNFNTAQELVKHGAGVNDVGLLKRTPLLIAADDYKSNYNYDTLNLLVTHGADINAQDLFGRTALHYLTGSNDLRVLRLLIDRGADLNLKDVEGNTPLAWAKARGNKNAIDLLLSKGAHK